jgi:ABC-type Fe3+ transport system substrate-binding protein
MANNKVTSGSRYVAGVLSGALIVVFAAFQPAIAKDPYDKLVAMAKAEMAKKGGKITMSLDWPKPDTKRVLPAFKKQYPFIKEIKYKRERGIGPFGRYLIAYKQGKKPPYDIMHVASEFQKQFWDAGAFVKPPFDYSALSNSVPAGWPRINEAALDPEGKFLSTTAMVRGNIWNSKVVPAGKEPTTWSSCLDASVKGRVLIDSRNKSQAFQHDPKERSRHLAWLDGLLKNDAVILRGQGSIVRKVASGEYPVACMVNYHTAQRMIDKGVKDLKFTLADTIPLELGTRLYVAKWSDAPATTQLFALWLTTGGQKVLGKYAYRGYPTNPTDKNYSRAKGKYIALCGADCALRWGEYNREHQVKLRIPMVKKKKKKKKKK